jgi:hypothetical protein
VLGVDHLVDERLAGGHVEGRRRAEEERQEVDVPELDPAGDGKEAHHEGGAAHQRLRPVEHRLLREAVRQDAGER